jgi:peptide/nickel transport system substrate-binding protein
MAISQAISRPDICRIVYRGRAVPAAGPVSSANRFWFDQSLKPYQFNSQAALAELRKAGFSRSGGGLLDQGGHPVEFSLITNSGNQLRERMATMIQHDLGQMGIRLNVVQLDFPSLIERISRTWNYEACLLGLVNVDLDPNAQMNVWLSSASNHQWNPNQPKPATPWEAEVDRLMHAQASTTDASRRKTLFDQVQKIVWRECPFLYLVNRSALAAVSPALKNLKASPLFPQTFWNVEELYLEGGTGAK